MDGKGVFSSPPTPATTAATGRKALEGCRHGRRGAGVACAGKGEGFGWVEEGGGWGKEGPLADSCVWEGRGVEKAQGHAIQVPEEGPVSVADGVVGKALVFVAVGPFSASFLVAQESIFWQNVPPCSHPTSATTTTTTAPKGMCISCFFSHFFFFIFASRHIKSFCFFPPPTPHSLLMLLSLGRSRRGVSPSLLPHTRRGGGGRGRRRRKEGGKQPLSFHLPFVHLLLHAGCIWEGGWIIR